MNKHTNPDGETKSSGYQYSKLDTMIEGFRSFAEKAQNLLSLITIGRIDSIDYSGPPTRIYSAMIRLSQRYYDVRIILDDAGEIVAVSVNRDDRMVVKPLQFEPVADVSIKADKSSSITGVTINRTFK